MLETPGGSEISTEGDSFFAAFTSAPDAVRAAVGMHDILAREPWPEGGEIRVRIGMHTGEGRALGDTYVGLDVHRAARISAVGYGGQTLLSAATRELVAAKLPSGSSLRDLGLHRLKDRERPEHIFEIVAPGQQRHFSPPPTLGTGQSNLPAATTTFVGRSRERSEIVELLRADRLITLVGVGGRARVG